MSKTMLVAQREFVENMRTKTFWIGILSFPVLILLAVFVGKLLEKSKDVRTYAVIDRSEGEWLSESVYASAGSQDFAAALREIGEKRDPDATPETRRAQFTAWVDSLPDDHPLTEILARLRPLIEAGDLDPEALEDNPSKLPPAVMREFLAWAAEVGADPKKRRQLESLAADLAMSRYRRVFYDELGEDREKALNQKVYDGELFAYFVIGDDPVESAEGSKYVSNNFTDDDLRKWFTRHAADTVRKARIEKLALSEEAARSILDDFSFGTPQKATETGATADVGNEEKASSFAPVAFVYLLWIAVFTAANMLLTNTIEEKSNRLIEVLLSSVSPMQLMVGKVIGIGATGLTIIVAWIFSAIAGSKALPQFGGVDIAAIIGDPLYLASFVGYFLAGYLLYAAFLVAIGSVCNSLKEAQGLMQPVVVVLIVPLLAMVFVVQDPNGTVARFLTYIPPFTPFLMMNRAGGPPPAWEYAASSALIFVSLALAFWGAAKIFRIGILMTGKPPRVGEILQWLRAPVGQVAVREEP